MKKRITALALAIFMVMGTVAIAAGTEKTISVTPMNMTINGQEVTPTKSDGTAAEVFAYDGATYVPLRYLSELLGIQVEWDKDHPNTATLVNVPNFTAPAAGFKAGTYTGEGQGFGGTIKVAVTLSATRIEKVEVTENSETPGIGSVAVEKLPGKIVEAQSTQVDVIASATLASNGILEAVNAALKSAGVDPATLKPGVGNANANAPTTKDADVVIVGAGGAGMTAAITAARTGKKVILLEKLALVGGNTSKATGGMNAAETEWQDKNTFGAGGEEAAMEKVMTNAEKYPALADLAATVQKEYDDWKAAGSKGYFDTVNLMILDTMIGGYGINNIDLVTVLAKNSAAGIAFIDSIDGTLHDVASFGGATVKRIHRPVNEKGQSTAVGAYLVPVLEKACKDAGVEIVFETPVDEILMKDGKAVGVKSSATGLTVNAKSVVLATGGFGANLPMVAQYKPELDGFVTTNAPGCTGDGIKMAQAVGAAVVDMDQIQIHPTVEQKTSALITEGIRGDGAILVNQEGKRFCDDNGLRSEVANAELAQTGGYAYLILDQKMMDGSATYNGYYNKGFAVKADSYEELAKAIGAPEKDFVATMNTWNKAVADKKDAEFNRTSFKNPLDTAPYYAIQIAPGIHHTMGGVVINTETEVLTASGTAIGNLYAAGEVTGGVHGGNRLGGNAVCDIVVFGQIAGANAAANAK